MNRPLRADLGQRHVGDLVAGGLDDFDAALVAQRGQPRLHPVGLPQGELRTARCDDKHESILEVKRLSDGGDHVRALGLAGVVAQLGDRAVRDLVDDAAGERLRWPASCSGVSGPNLRRTFSISPARICSSCSCRLDDGGRDLGAP